MSYDNSTEGVFDYGTQYFSAKNPQFQVWVNDWLKHGVIKEWCQGFGQSDGKPRYCGVNGTRGIAEYLAQDLDVHTNTKVVEIGYDSHWLVKTEDEQQYQGEMLLLTLPVPQSLDLLDASLMVLPLDVRFALENISYHRCITVLALLEKPSNIPAPGGIALENNYLTWLADNHQKGISPDGYAMTLHASPGFSEDYWNSDDAEIAYKLLTTAADYLDSPVIKYQVHRWRYSLPKTFHSEPYLALSEIPLLMAGDGFVAPNIEGAALSGIAVGELIAKRFKG
jgi:predicted NAD/FAD-dependent oxidoreductase